MTSPSPGESGVGLLNNIKIEKGLGLFRGNLEKAFQVAEQLGYDGLEVALADPDEINIKLLHQWVNHYKINIASLATGAIATKDGFIFSSPEKSIRQAAVQRIKKFIDLATGFNSLVVISLVRGGITKGEEQSKEWITECLIQCSQYAKKNGIYLAFEPINRFQDDFFHSILDCMHYLEKNHLSNLGLLIDSFHMNIEDNDMWENIKKANQSIIHVHYADNNRLAPGLGHFDFQQMTKILQEIGYTGYLSAEILPYPDSYTAAKQFSSKIKEYLK